MCLTYAYSGNAAEWPPVKASFSTAGTEAWLPRTSCMYCDGCGCMACVDIVVWFDSADLPLCASCGKRKGECDGC